MCLWRGGFHRLLVYPSILWHSHICSDRFSVDSFGFVRGYTYYLRVIKFCFSLFNYLIDIYLFIPLYSLVLGDQEVINDLGETTRILQLVADVCKGPVKHYSSNGKTYITDEITLRNLSASVPVSTRQEQPGTKRWIRFTASNFWQGVMHQWGADGKGN